MSRTRLGLRGIYITRAEACEMRWTGWFRFRGETPPSFDQLPPMTAAEIERRDEIMRREGVEELP